MKLNQEPIVGFGKSRGAERHSTFGFTSRWSDLHFLIERPLFRLLLVVDFLVLL
jgi:hypothetical protein